MARSALARSAILASVFLVLLAARPALSTTVVPPTFAELVSKAAVIFEGEVIDRRSLWEPSRDGRHIVTVVTFNVSRVLKGQLGLRTELSFLGGTVGDQTMHVEGMPTFAIGDQDVLFVSADVNPASPLVGFWHGRFRIVREASTGALTVRAYNGAAVLAGFDGVQAGAGLGRPLRLSEFEALILGRVNR
jgi:hypothetical protein